MKQVFLKTGVILTVTDEVASQFMCALEKGVDARGVYINDNVGSHTGFLRVDAVDAIVDFDVNYKEIKS